MEQREHSSIAVESANLYRCFGNKYGSFLELVFLKSQLYYSNIYPKDSQSCHNDISMYYATLFIITSTWKQLRCLSTEFILIGQHRPERKTWNVLTY